MTAVAILIAGLGISGCSKRSGGSASAARRGGANRQQAIPVAVTPAGRSDIAARFTLTGSVTPAQQANLSSLISGPVQSVNAQIGDRVSAGETLVKIDDSTLRAQLQQDLAAADAARARLAQTQATDVGASATTNANLQSARVAFLNAQATLRRNQQLFAQGYVSQSAVDQAQQQAAAAQAQLRAAEVSAQNANLGGNGGTAAQAEIHSAQAAVAQAQAAIGVVQTQIAQTSVTAPFDGVVTQRNVDPGSLAAPNTTLMQISQVDPVFVNVGIPDNDLQFVHAGTSVSLTVDTLPGRSWRGKVSHLNAATAQGTLSYLARISIPNHDAALRSGMVANATFVQAMHRGALVVPRSAVVQTDNGSAVYVVRQHKAKLVPVIVGVQTENQSEVRGSGVGRGTLVITQRPDALQDGSPVQIVGAQGGAARYSSQTSR
jgi:multidrug resistance efflux pump